MARTTSSAWSQVIQNRLVALVLAMIVFVPFVATTTDAGTHGVAALSFEGFSILLLATLIWRARWRFSRDTVVAFLKTGGNTPVLLFGALTVVSCILAPRKAYAIQETMRVLAGIMLYFTVAYQFRRSEQQTRLVDVVMLVAIGAAAVGLFQFGLSPEEQQYASGLFGDHQLYGSFLMLLLPIVAVIAITERAPNRQLIAQIGTLFTIIALLVSHSRSAWIGGSAGMASLGVIAIYLSTKKVSAAARRHELVVPLMLIVVSVGFFMLVSPQAKSIVDRAGSIKSLETDRGWQYRQQAWRGAEAMVRSHPIFGVGIGQYSVQQQKYSFTGRPGFFFTNSKDPMAPALGEQAHNLYLQTAAELGLPGLILFLAALSAFLGAALQKVATMDTGTRRTLLLGSMASVIAFAVDAFGSPAWQYGQVSMFFWLVLGIGTGCLRPRAKHISRPLPEDGSPRSTKSSRTIAVLTTLGFAALLPTMSLAGVSAYLIPISATISPLNATIARGASQQYDLMVLFHDPNTGLTVGPDDVTDCPVVTNGSGVIITQCNFTQTGGDGSMTSTNNSVYQSLTRENDVPTITGTYLQNGVTVSASTTLTVGSG